MSSGSRKRRDSSSSSSDEKTSKLKSSVVARKGKTTPKKGKTLIKKDIKKKTKVTSSAEKRKAKLNNKLINKMNNRLINSILTQSHLLHCLPPISIKFPLSFQCTGPILVRINKNTCLWTTCGSRQMQHETMKTKNAILTVPSATSRIGSDAGACVGHDVSNGQGWKTSTTASQYN